MMNLDKSYVNRLLYFYFVASCKNISHAAREIGLHQSALSRQMIKLEKEIGMCLMKRHKNGVLLTRKGEELFESTRRIFTELQITRRKLDEEGEVRGKIRISSTHAVMNYILAEHLINFNKLYPDIHLDIVCDDYTIDLIKNEVDVAIRPYDAITPNLIQVPLFKLQAKLYASSEYIERNGFPSTIEDLSKHKFIAWSRSFQLPFNIPVDWFLKIEGHTSQENCVMNVNSVEMLYKAAYRGRGIISAYENMEIFGNSDLVQVAPALEGEEQQDYFIYSKQMQNCKRIELLKCYLEKEVKI